MCIRDRLEPFRVEQKTDYDKLVLEITTDVSIHPKEALKEAAKILIYHFMLFSDEKITLERHLAASLLQVASATFLGATTRTFCTCQRKYLRILTADRVMCRK